ncbi:MAG: 3'-5' exonuclease [Simkania sp.]|nr:3'-5' exonuclease [Simkania sp.]
MLGVFLDTETNGLNPFKHKIIEIAFKIIDVESGLLKESFQSLVSISPSDWKNSDPESLKVNGFSWSDVQVGKPITAVAEEVRILLTRQNIIRGQAVFICQNPSFDRAFFSQIFTTEEQEAQKLPYHWLDLASMFWAVSIAQGKLPWMAGYSKDKIAAAYHLPPEAQPHRAMNGVNHLLQCYEAVVGFPQ